MALPPLRSMNANLTDGMTEGGHKRLSRNRGGFVEETTNIARQHLYGDSYSITETHRPTRADETCDPWLSENTYEHQSRTGSPTYESQMRPLG